ncbi:MAG: tetratricopeptide repeat protein [Acidobacteria bacterium]|nr:tetratricopeptide repeat protein [Acidobacteriota bacterium]
MKKWIPVIGVAALVAALGVWHLAAGKRPEWTTSSPQALAEFQAGMDSTMKMYTGEAQKHFEKAVQLDPDFLMARLELLLTGNQKGEYRKDKLKALVESADLDRLNPRERFMVERLKAGIEGRRADADKILDDYLAQHPEDPYALFEKASVLWHTGKLDEAKKLFQRLIKVAPNWVLAYNSLGYIAMQLEDFEKSEENFTTYRFIAPDQANPHDSLGELLNLTGRYTEAEKELDAALATKPDFCASYNHLAWTHLLEDRPEAARQDLQRLSREEGCATWVNETRCMVDLWAPARQHQWKQVLELAKQDDCLKDGKLGSGPGGLYAYTAAAMLGDNELCDKVEAPLEKAIAKEGKAPHLEAVLSHLQGVRAAAAGHYVKAAKLLRKADEGLTFAGSADGLFKLYNQACLAEVLQKAGDASGAVAVIRQVRRVNPKMAQSFESGRWRPLGV